MSGLQRLLCGEFRTPFQQGVDNLYLHWPGGVGYFCVDDTVTTRGRVRMAL